MFTLHLTITYFMLFINYYGTLSLPTSKLYFLISRKQKMFFFHELYALNIIMKLLILRWQKTLRRCKFKRKLQRFYIKLEKRKVFRLFSFLMLNSFCCFLRFSIIIKKWKYLFLYCNTISFIYAMYKLKNVFIWKYF